MRSARAALGILAIDIATLAETQGDSPIAAQLLAFKERIVRIEDQLRQADPDAVSPAPVPSNKAWQQVRAGMSPTGSRSASPALSLRYGSRPGSVIGAQARNASGALLAQRLSVAEVIGNYEPTADDWQWRYCALKPTILEIYADENAAQPRVACPLTISTVTRAGETIFCVEYWAAQLDPNGVDVEEQRHAVLCAVETREQLREWLHCLHNAKRELCATAMRQAAMPAVIEEEDSPFTSLVSQLLDPPPSEPPPPPPPPAALSCSSPLPLPLAVTPPSPLSISPPRSTFSPIPLSTSPPEATPPVGATRLTSSTTMPSSPTAAMRAAAAAASVAAAAATASRTSPPPELPPPPQQQQQQQANPEIPNSGPLVLRFFQRNNRKALSVDGLQGSRVGAESPSKVKRDQTGLWQRIVKREGSNDVQLVRISPPPEVSAPADATPLTESERRERQVKAVIAELISTETEHQWSLQLASKHYLRGVSDLIRHDELNWLTGPLERLVATENEFCTKLQAVNDAAELALVFTSFSEMLRSAYVPYCVHYDEAVALLRQFRQRPEVAKRLTELQRSPECRQLDLDDLLIKPPQRLCRYPLILKELVRALPPDSPAVRPVETALRVMEDLLRAANETKRQSETIHLLVQLKELIRWPPGLEFDVLPHRQLLRRAAFARISAGKDPNLFRGSLLLFTDCLLVLEQRKTGRAREDHARDVLMLNECAVLGVAKNNVFTVSRTVAPGARVVVMTATSQEKEEWMNVLTAQVTANTAPVSPR